MQNLQIVYTPIGRVQSPYTRPDDIPIQPCGARGVAAQITIYPAYR